MLPQPELQLRTLTLYGELLSRQEHWVHKLTLAAFEGASDSGLAAASTLVGAASLTIDSDIPLVKQHFRDGAFDFVVNTLDEALRALKNEIRQGRPIAVALTASPDATLAEATARGLTPNFTFHPDLRPNQAWLAARRWRPAELTTPADLSPTDPIRLAWLQHLPTYQRSVRTGPRWGWVEAAS